MIPFIGIVLGSVRSWLGKAVSWATSHPALAAIVLLSAFAGYECRVADKERHRADTCEGANRKAVEAGKAELFRATAERDAAIKKAKEQDDESDKRVAAAESSDAANLAAYEQRLRAARVARDSRPLPTSGETLLAESRDRSGGDTILAQSLDNDRICTINTRRLLEINREAVGDNP